MVSFRSRRGEAGARTLPLMILAFVVAGGFFTWLYIQGSTEEVVVVEGGPAEEVMGATTVATDAFGMNPVAHLDQDVQVHRLGVNSSLGPRALFIDLPNQTSPYLVLIAPEAISGDLALEAGATISVTGTVKMMSDSIADAWVASGGLDEGSRLLAVFAESFFEAWAVTLTGQAPAGTN